MRSLTPNRRSGRGRSPDPLKRAERVGYTNRCVACAVTPPKRCKALLRTSTCGRTARRRGAGRALLLGCTGPEGPVHEVQCVPSVSRRRASNAARKSPGSPPGTSVQAVVSPPSPRRVRVTVPSAPQSSASNTETARSSSAKGHLCPQRSSGSPVAWRTARFGRGFRSAKRYATNPRGGLPTLTEAPLGGSVSAETEIGHRVHPCEHE